MSNRDHWEGVYSKRPIDQVGWYTPHLQTSLAWIARLALHPEARIIDVGGGASTLVDDLLARGYRSITVLDLSKTALSIAKARLGEKAAMVTWVEGDVTTFDFPSHRYDVWHDRAAFHFLTSSEQQQRYVEQMTKAVKDGGYVIMATFSLESPPTCSGLPVQRYSAEHLERVLGERFVLKETSKELHLTPRGGEQMYLYCLFRKVP
nr:class I SAM-dependent methyltransferase [Ardenticatena sp.]